MPFEFIVSEGNLLVIGAFYLSYQENLNLQKQATLGKHASVP